MSSFLILYELRTPLPSGLSKGDGSPENFSSLPFPLTSPKYMTRAKKLFASKMIYSEPSTE